MYLHSRDALQVHDYIVIWLYDYLLLPIDFSLLFIEYTHSIPSVPCTLPALLESFLHQASLLAGYFYGSPLELFWVM